MRAPGHIDIAVKVTPEPDDVARMRLASGVVIDIARHIALAGEKMAKLADMIEDWPEEEAES